MCLTGLSCSRHLWQCESTLLFLFDYKIPAKILFSSYLRVCFVVQVMFLDKYDKWWSTQCFKICQSVLNLEASKVDLTLNIISKFLTYIVHKAESFIEMQQVFKKYCWCHNNIQLNHWPANMYNCLHKYSCTLPSFVLLSKALQVALGMTRQNVTNSHAYLTGSDFKYPTCITSDSCFMNKLLEKIHNTLYSFFSSHSLQSFLYDNQKPLAAVKPRRREIIFFIEIRLKW